VTTGEFPKFRPFTEVLGETPPAPPPAPTEDSRGLRTWEQQEKAFQWASTTLFHEFFFVRNLHSPTAVAATVAAASATDVGQESTGSEDGSFVDLVSDGDGGVQQESANSSSEYSSGVLEHSAGESSSRDTEEDAASTEGGRGTERGSTEAGGLPQDSAAGAAVEENLELDLGVQTMALEAVPQALPVTPPSPGESSEFFLLEPGGTDGAVDEFCVTESVKDVGPKTKDCWRVPLSSVEKPAGTADANSDNPVEIYEADPASPLTQRAVSATLAASKRRRTRGLFTMVQVGKIPIA